MRTTYYPSPLFRQAGTASFVFLLSLFLVACTVMIGFAQNSTEADRGLTMAEYDEARTFKLNDMDNDTYVKIENTYILDRYEMKPPYVFKYSDGIERRIYLYKMLDNKTRKDLGMLAMYHLPSSGKTINVLIPNATADKQVWARYIDDLKELGEKETGFLSTFAYTLSREMSLMLGNGSGQVSTASQGKIDYDVCFPAGTMVTLTDGSQRTIETLKAGDQIAAYNQESRQLESTTIQEVEVHDGKEYTITSLMAVRRDVLTASIGLEKPMSAIRMDATNNHPVLTKDGRKAMGDLQAGEMIFGYDESTGELVELEVRQFFKSYRTVSKVYNLVTDKNNYLANSVVVLDK